MSLWTTSFQNLYQNLQRHTKTVKHCATVISVRLFYKTSTAYLKENAMMNVFLSLSMQTKILFTLHFVSPVAALAVDLISGNMHDFGGGSELPPYSVQYWKMER